MICTKKTAILTLSLATTWSVNALAQPQNSISQPPLEAYTACEGKQPGEKSHFVTKIGNTISGQCKQQQDGRLILIPVNLRGGSKIPPAAYQECIGKQLGDAAQVTIPTGETVSGTCQLDGDRLYLRPDSSPGMHGGMKTHTGGQYQELQNGSRQPDTRQQAPQQNEDDRSYGNQQQSVPPENMHSNVQQRQEPDTRQQAPQQNETDSPSDNQQQSSPPEDMHSNVQQQQPPQQTGRGDGKSKAPEPAYKACEGKKAGDEVQLTTPQGQKVIGTCEQDGDRLFLRPNRPSTPNENTSSDNVQQHQNDPAYSADQPEEQQSQASQQPRQRPQEKPKGLLGKMKDFWKKLW